MLAGGEDEEDDLGATPRPSEEKVRMFVLDSKQNKERNGMYNIGFNKSLPNDKPSNIQAYIFHNYFIYV